MKLTIDDELYEILMIDYQITEVARLNQILLQNGIDDPALRARICTGFADSNGSYLDQGWLDLEEARAVLQIPFHEDIRPA